MIFQQGPCAQAIIARLKMDKPSDPNGSAKPDGLYFRPGTSRYISDRIGLDISSGKFFTA